MAQRATDRLLASWDRLRRIPGGRALFHWMVGRVAPYSGSISARVEELEPGHARVALPDRRKVRNPFRSIHAIALCNLGELATGLAMSSVMPADLRGIPVALEIEYLKKARGTITADARCEPPSLGAGGAETDRRVAVDLTDGAGDVVARFAARWRIGPRS